MQQSVGCHRVNAAVTTRRNQVQLMHRPRNDNRMIVWVVFSEQEAQLHRKGTSEALLWFVKSCFRDLVRLVFSVTHQLVAHRQTDRLRDGRTNGQTQEDSTCRTSLASGGKNWSRMFLVIKISHLGVYSIFHGVKVDSCRQMKKRSYHCPFSSDLISAQLMYSLN